MLRRTSSVSLFAINHRLTLLIVLCNSITVPTSCYIKLISDHAFHTAHRVVIHEPALILNGESPNGSGKFVMKLNEYSSF